MTDPERLQVGVCTILVESQPDHLLIRVTTNLNLDRNLYSARPDVARKFSDPEAALDAVAEFFRNFV
jgi:ethanolamine ammonia-lyase small subunit